MTDAIRATKAPRTWYFFGTLGFTLLAALASLLGGFVTLVVLLLVHRVPMEGAYEQMMTHVYWKTAAGIGSVPGELAGIWFAVRWARRRFSEYLALRWPTAQDLVLALLVMLAVIHIVSFIGQSMGETLDAGVLAEFGRARRDGPLTLFFYLVMGCIAAPIVEEFAVRGFMLRGWSESFLRPAGAIVLTAAFWAICHTQYNWFGVFEIFVIGLVLGYYRLRSGSTWLTVVVHSANNIYSYLIIGLLT
ncbi:CPBP family intramembrane glutamic endopeptidase [Bradyrhizobium sp. SRS-191]|uniref:CPBP family intramembrane glutamic endopeptidase n=1 Tax=Bradyrhizobium sp. SRS-191 TaxID=2962606 RepID=UPI00211E189D|nr:CPBP family intramembrane glutamic endopeptidase [Bradyrhizobium sp. SRS-191]